LTRGVRGKAKACCPTPLRCRGTRSRGRRSWLRFLFFFVGICHARASEHDFSWAVSALARRGRRRGRVARLLAWCMLCCSPRHLGFNHLFTLPIATRHGRSQATCTERSAASCCTTRGATPTLLGACMIPTAHRFWFRHACVFQSSELEVRPGLYIVYWPGFGGTAVVTSI